MIRHETTHWTRAPSRLERDFGRKRWGDEGYAIEELVAEIGAAFLAADLNIMPEVPWMSGFLRGFDITTSLTGQLPIMM